MADQPGADWLDLLEEDIPVVDQSGKQLLVKGLDFIERGAPAASPTPPAAAGAASPPANLPVAAAPAADRQRLDIVQKTDAVISSQPEVRLANVTKDDFVANTSKDAADLKKIEAIIAAKAVEPQKKSEATLLDTIADQGVTDSGVSLPDEDMRRRFRTLISLYLRDLRDGLETKSKFTMPVQSGGMGLADADAERVMAELQKKKDEYRAGLSGKAADDKAKYVAERTEKILGEQDATDKKEQVKMEQAFSGLLERSGVVASGAATASPMPQAAAPAPTEPKLVTVVGLDAAGKPTAVTPAAPPPPPSPVAATPPAVQPPPRPLPPFSPSAVSTPAGAKPVMADVKYSPKLTGPVEELRSITLKDFRHLSREPREATLKLKDKIDLLEEQSFEVKTQGIRAWQDSEVNKLYLDILRKSLEGKPVNDVIAEREAKAEPTLSKAEFDSIMDLNRKLRFG
ncbi:MAG TPA: hypothetical protein VL500_00325 [Candidatus Eisenbacteria bacterium]|nr:hypothetical protein [Candidatus Eisenbacteria bacterium]